MREGTCNRVSVSLACLLGLALLLSAGTALAKKPAPPPPPPTYSGTIYFVTSGDSGASIFRVDVAESDPEPEEVLSGVSVAAVSHAKHDGDHWLAYSDATSEDDPDGATRNMLVLVSASGGTAYTILINDPLLSLRGNRDGNTTITWEPGDDAVTFVGLRWTDDGSGAQFADAGMYRQSLTWSSDGSSVTASGTPVRIADAAWDEVDDTLVSAHFPYMSWSPDGTQLVTSVHLLLEEGSLLTVYDVITSDVTVIRQAALCNWGWSADGEWIVFQEGLWPSICRIDPTGGTPEVLLGSGSSRKTAWWWRGAAWAPAGSAITSMATEVKYGRTPSDDVKHKFLRIYDVSSGVETTVLQDDAATWPVAWRP